MRRRNPYTPKFGNYHDTWVTCAGVELDNCRIYFDDSPPEPDIGYSGDFTVESVEYQGRDVYSEMSGDEVEDVADRIVEYINSWYEDGDQ